MTDPVELDATLVQLIRRLCDAGELDAAVGLIDFLKLQGATSKSLLPLRALAFLSEDATLDKKREVLRGVRAAMLDALARMGALAPCATIYRLLAEVFPDDRIWRRKLRRVELVLSPLPGADVDPERAGVTDLLVEGKAHDALSALRSVARRHPEDPKLQQRVDELKNLLFEPSSTRPYRVLSPEEAERLSVPSELPPPLEGPESHPELHVEPPQAIDPAPVREAVLSALLAGELSRAEPAARTLAKITRDESLTRAAESIERLAAIQRAETASNVNEEITMRLSPEATVDLWVRQGMLSRALDQARELLVRPENKDCERVLSQRLNDLERVLALIPSPGAAPAPEPQPEPEPAPAPEPVAAVAPAPVEVAVEFWNDRRASPPADERATTEFAVIYDVVSLVPPEPVAPVPLPPTPSAPPPEPVAAKSSPDPSPPVAPASTKVAKRKVVRLG